MNAGGLHHYLTATFTAGNVAIDDRFLAHVGVTPFLSDHVPRGLLAIRDAVIEPVSGATVTVTGTTTLLGIEVDARIDFNEVPSGFDLLVTAVLPADWKFSDSFENLPESLNYSQGFPYLQDTFLDELSISDVIAYISSAPAEAQPGVHIGDGVSLAASLRFDGPLAEVAEFAGSATADLSGGLDLTGDTPSLDLRAPVPFAVTFGDISLDDVEIVLFSSLDAAKRTDSYFQIESTLKVDGFELDIATRLVLGSADLIVQEGKFVPDQVKVPSLGQLANLVGADDLEQSLPAALRGDTGLYFSDVALTLRPSDKTVLFVELELESSEGRTWPVVPDILEVGNAKLAWHVIDPLNTSQARALSLAIAGTMFIDGVGFDVTARLPDGFVLCSLGEDDEIDLGRLFTHVGLDLDVVGISDLRCTELRLSADVAGADYGFYTELTSDWKIPIGSQQLTITGLSFEFDTTRDSTRVDAAGTFEIAGAALFLSGRSESTGGWAFEGGTSGTSQINLTHLVAELLQLFGASLPSEVPDITLRNLDVRFNTATKEFDFEGQTDTEIEVPFIPGEAGKIHAEVKLASTVDGSTGKRQLAGYMEGDLTIGSSLFTLQYEIGKESHVFRASWESTDEADLLGIDTLLAAIGASHDVEIPSGVDLNLKKAYLEYQAERETLTLVADSATYGQAFLMASKLPLGAPDPSAPPTAEGSWEFVFGLEYAGHSQLSDIPVLGDELGAADIFRFEELGILISSADVKAFAMPQLPALQSVDVGSGAAATTPARRPVAADTTLQLAKGISVVGVIAIDQGEQTGEITALRTVIPETHLTISASWSPGARITLRAVLDGSVTIPTGGSSDLEIGNAALEFIFADDVIFRLSGELAMHFDHQTIDVTPAIAISAEAFVFSVDVEFEDGWHAPMGIAGLTLDEVGFLLGVEFLPAPGLDLGLEGKSHIGNHAPAGDDFAFVLEMVEEIPNPLLLSFYLDEIDVKTAMQVFAPEADTSSLPSFVNDLEVTQLSFYWAESVVTLPDGTVAQPGLRFGGNVDIFGFEAHAALEIDQIVGIAGDLETSPIHVAPILAVTGHGKGVFINERNGRPVQLKALPAADTHDIERVQVVPPGGPAIQFRTSQSPYLYVTLLVSFLDIEHVEVEALVTSDGILFKLVYGITDVAEAELDFTVGKDGFKLHSQFGLHLKADLGPVEILGVDFGTIHLDAGFDIELEVDVGPERFLFEITGNFEFEGARLDLPTLRLDVAPSSLAELPELIIEHIIRHLGEIFGDMFAAAEQFFEDAGKAIGEAAEAVGHEIVEVGEKALAEAEQIVGDAEQAVEHAVDAVAHEVQEIKDKAKEILDEAETEAAEILTAAEHEVEKIGGEIAEVATEAVHEIEAIGEEIAQEATVVAHEIEHLASEAVHEVEEIGRAVEQEVAKILDDARKVADGIIHAARAVVDALAAEAAKLWNEAKHLAEAAAHALESAGHAIASTAKKAWNAIKKY